MEINCSTDTENGFSYLEQVQNVLVDRGTEFWGHYMKEQLVRLLDLLSPPLHEDILGPSGNQF